MIGGSTNRVSISRGWILLKELYISNTLDTEKTTHFLLEITIGGEIVLYSSQLDGRSLIVAHDPNPSPMHYIGFGADVHFFYGCKNDTPFRTVPKHPHLNMNLLAKINAGNRKCSMNLRVHKIPFLIILLFSNGPVLQTCRHMELQL